MPKMAVRKSKPSKKSNNFEKFKLNQLIKKIILTSLFLSFFSGLFFYGVDSWKTIWPVKKITIQGDVKYLNQSNLVEFVKQQSTQGMLAIDLNAMQSSAKEIEWIKNVEIRKIWPDQLTFMIEEYQPVARVNQYILTQQGTKILDNNSSKKLMNLPNIEISKAAEKNNFNYIELWKELKKIKKQFELISLNLSSLYIDQANNWHLEFIEKITLNLGRKNRTERVFRLINVYSAIENKNNIKLIDLRYHNGIAVEWFDEKKQSELKG